MYSLTQFGGIFIYIIYCYDSYQYVNTFCACALVYYTRDPLVCALLLQGFVWGLPGPMARVLGVCFP